MIPAVILIQAGMLVCLAAAVYIPVKNFAETLDGFTQKDSTTDENVEEELRQAAGRVPYMGQIERLSLIHI